MRHFDLRNGSSLADEIKRRGIDILGEIPFPLTQDRFDFASSCLSLYEKHYPEIILEIQSLTRGLKVDEKILFTLFLSMYAIVPSAHCSCIAMCDDENVFLGRNSDFYIQMKNLNSHFIYDFPFDVWNSKTFKNEVIRPINQFISKSKCKFLRQFLCHFHLRNRLY